MKKRCAKCFAWKDVEKFDLKTDPRYRGLTFRLSRCKVCVQRYWRNPWRKKNASYHREYMRLYRKFRSSPAELKKALATIRRRKVS